MANALSITRKSLLFQIIALFLIFVLAFSSGHKNYGEPETNNKNDKFTTKSRSHASSINYSLTSSQERGVQDATSVTTDIDQMVIIIFDRGYKSQFTEAKPILDKYGFKASFFVICSFIDDKGYYKLSGGKEVLSEYDNAMSWDQLRLLHEEGHDIESHGMEHRYLSNLTLEKIEDEISGSRECLEEHGFKPIHFQIPSNRGGADNSTILKMITKYFDFGLAGHSRLMFLNCDGWINHGYKTKNYKNQYDCNPFSPDGTPTRTNKLTIKEWSHDREHSKINKDNPSLTPHENEIYDKLFAEFVSVVEAQNQYNQKAGKIVAIPIIGYHSISNDGLVDTSAELFEREMKYLHTNGFKVMKLTDLGYDEEANHFYIK